MSDYWSGEECSKCGSDIYTDENGGNRWCHVCEEEPDEGGSGMTREVKFRAWDKEENEMLELVTVGCTRKDSWGPLYIKDNIINGFDHRNYEVMQYTGLIDKNGVEIYEGDVVVDRWAYEHTPVFRNGIYMAYNPKNLMQNNPSTQFNVIWKDGCEVIGNIYENPELMEVVE